MPDLDELLRSEISLAAAQAVDTCDFAIIERRAVQRRRTRTVLAMSAAAVAVVLTVVASLQVASSPRSAPTIPIQQPTPTADPVVNGRLQRVTDYLAGLRPACVSCGREESVAFEPSTGAVLLASRAAGSGEISGLRVIGLHGQLARLTCPDDFPCPPDSGVGVWDYGTALGPGADEITVEHADRNVQVIGFDGALRRTIDLSASLDEGEQVDDLAWSPDRSRLVVKTTRGAGSGLVRRLWLVDRYGGRPQLVHTARYAGQPPKGTHPLAYVWSLSWSPDSSRLGFIEEHSHIGTFEISVSMRALSLLLPGPGHDGPGVARTIYEYTTRPFDSAAVVWSPDGTRRAVRAEKGVLELSAEDGRALTQHPTIGGFLIWPARQS